MMNGQITKKKIEQLELIIKESGLDYRKEVMSKEWQILTNALGTDEKRFDFVITTKKKNYLMEVNFYSGGGSKLNATARSFTEINNKLRNLTDFEFVWITDGKGWLTAKNKLQEAFYAIPNMYNLTTIKTFLNKIKNDNV